MFPRRFTFALLAASLTFTSALPRSKLPLRSLHVAPINPIPPETIHPNLFPPPPPVDAALSLQPAADDSLGESPSLAIPALSPDTVDTPLIESTASPTPAQISSTPSPTPGLLQSTVTSASSATATTQLDSSSSTAAPTSSEPITTSSTSTSLPTKSTSPKSTEQVAPKFTFMSLFNSSSRWFPVGIASIALIVILFLLFLLFVAKRIAHLPRFADKKSYPGPTCLPLTLPSLVEEKEKRRLLPRPPPRIISHPPPPPRYGHHSEPLLPSMTENRRSFVPTQHLPRPQPPLQQQYRQYRQQHRGFQRISERERSWSWLPEGVDEMGRATRGRGVREMKGMGEPPRIPPGLNGRARVQAVRGSVVPSRG